MSLHRSVWWATLLVGVVPAALLAVVVAPRIEVVVTTTALGLLGGALLSGVSWSWSTWSANAVAATLVLDAAPVLTWRALPVLLILLTTSTTFVRVIRARTGFRRVAGKPDRVQASVRSTYVGACLGAMSGRELCRAWSTSFVRVKSASARERRIEAAVRSSLLDEIERRDAGRFRDWLSRSPSAASDPLWVVTLPAADGRRRRRRSGTSRRRAGE